MAFLGLILSPVSVSAATKANFSYGAWFPFWKKADAILKFTSNIDRFHEISLFSYDVQKDGTLKDRLKMQSGPWSGWLTALHDLNIKILPTVAWFNGDEIDKILSNKNLRKAHIKEIMSLATAVPYNGVDIDYENKKAETGKYFSAFIKELSAALHAKKKILACSIEPRTPLSSRFTTIPKDVAYANDYKVLNSYCDEVRIMAYDQGNIDLLLNKTKGSNGNYYAPVADADWVEKIIEETAKTISRKKIVLGIPTYGAEYLIANDNGSITYKRLNSITYKAAVDLAKSLNITPVRNSAGELSFTYNAASSSQPASIHFVSFTDASAVNAKIELAKKDKLKGAMIFKIDNDGDPLLWSGLK